MRNVFIGLSSLVLGGLGLGCGSEDGGQYFELRFEAVSGDQPAGCESPVSGLGPDQAFTVSLSDLRFYVSNLQMVDEDGRALEVDWVRDEFQYVGDAGAAALVDLTSNRDGTCAENAIALSEGTARTNDHVAGIAHGGVIAGVSFDVGVPQSVMKELIATTTAEAAPSPMNEMYWSWNSGYRHLVLNFAIGDGSGGEGEGYVHVGSTDCGADGDLALADRERCGKLNTPRVELESFDPTRDVVAVDLGVLLEDLDFSATVTDPVTHEPLGETIGVRCHSVAQQPDCAPLFTSLGVDIATGDASGLNAVFHTR